MARYIGKGAEIQVQTASSPLTYVKVGQVMEFGGIDFNTDEVEVTTIDDNFRQFLQSVKDGGELPISVVFDPADTTHVTGANSLFELFQAGTEKTWRIRIPSSPAWGLTFSGYIKGIAFDVFSNSTAIIMNATVRVQGAPALAAI